MMTVENLFSTVPSGYKIFHKTVLSFEDNKSTGAKRVKGCGIFQLSVVNLNVVGLISSELVSSVSIRKTISCAGAIASRTVETADSPSNIPWLI